MEKQTKEWTRLECEQMSRAFDHGNFSNAYESQDLDWYESYLEEISEHERAAFVLGFFGSYSLDEIGSDREIFDESYMSAAGWYVINVAKFCDDRAEEYAEEYAQYCADGGI